jgi:hypothetical protein
LVYVTPVLDRVADFAALIGNGADDAQFSALRASELTGRALGNAEFVADLERRLGRPIARRAPGRKPRTKAVEQPDMF